MSETTQDYLNKFWELIDDILNAILFLFIGFELLLIPNILDYWLLGVLSIAIVLFSRFLSIWIPSKVIPFREKFSSGTIKILVWGGLRGGVSIALALSIHEGPYKKLIIAATYFVVVFSIIVQGLTIGKLAHKVLPHEEAYRVKALHPTPSTFFLPPYFPIFAPHFQKQVLYMRIAINGMGRIGRLLCRRLLQDPEVTVVAVNDIMDIDHLCYLLKYDSLYGSYAIPLHVEQDHIVAGNHHIRVMQQASPLDLPWKEMQVDVVIECSGKFTSSELAGQHLRAGAGRVLLSTTGSADIPLAIYGFNHHKVTRDISIISPGGCMTNCATHILYILNSIGIASAHIHMLHSYTSRQSLVDTSHAQYRRGRAAAESIIPVEIDLAQSLERLLPLKDKIATSSTRVPVTNGAMGDFVGFN